MFVTVFCSYSVDDWSRIFFRVLFYERFLYLTTSTPRRMVGWLVNCCHGLRWYLYFCLEGMGKATKTSTHDSPRRWRDSKPALPEYKSTLSSSDQMLGAIGLNYNKNRFKCFNVNVLNCAYNDILPSCDEHCIVCRLPWQWGWAWQVTHGCLSKWTRQWHLCSWPSKDQSTQHSFKILLVSTEYLRNCALCPLTRFPSARKLSDNLSISCHRLICIF
jgi:hypothetical protein